MNIVCCASLQRLCEWILKLSLDNRPRRFRTDRVPLDAIRWSHVMPLCDIFCKSKHNHHTLSTLYATDYSLLFDNAQNSTDIATLYPILFGSYDVCGGTHATNPLMTKKIDISITSYVTEMHETECFALQIKRPSSLPTVPNQTDFFK